MNLYLRRPFLIIPELKNRIFGADPKILSPYSSYFQGRIGLEIGGPSKIYRGDNYLPVYKYAERVDGVNFSGKTIWEGSIMEGQTYRYSAAKIGMQYICEGNELSKIADNSYDFILSCHNLEHFANPLRAVAEWKRVLKYGGVMLLILPDRRFTFDRRRSVTSFEHLKQDYHDNIGEDDLTHLEEILLLHDTKLDPPAKNPEFFKERSLNNFENRCLHHHVFDHELLTEIFRYFEIEPIFAGFAQPYHVISMGQLKSK
jgi:SAM-dependent methyltransferase